MKKALYIVKEVISWLLLVALLLTFAFTVYLNITNENKDEGVFLLGYRPVFVLTGSMEPYMMTNGMALTKAVSDIDELAVGDVVTYHVENEDGDLLRITHRIMVIDGDQIYTKGDNNNVADGFPLTIENIEAKVVGVWNGSAWFIDKWNSSTAGKIMLISFGVGAILLYICIKMAIKHLIEKRKAAKQPVADENAPEQIDVAEVDSAPIDPEAPVVEQPETATEETVDTPAVEEPAAPEQNG